jgi:hypothetical protein
MKITESLEKSPVFADLTGNEIQDIISLAKEHTYPKGDVISYEHSHGEELFISIISPGDLSDSSFPLLSIPRCIYLIIIIYYN